MSRRTGLRLGGAAVVALVLLAVIAEVVVGNAMRGRVAAAIEHRTGAAVSVDIGSRPALLDLVEGEIPVLRLSAVEVCGVPGVDVSARVEGVATGAPISCRQSAVTVGIDLAAIEGLLEGSKQGARLSRIGAELEADPGAGALLLRGGPGGLLEVPLRPVLRGDTLALEPGQATVFGRPLPGRAEERLGSVAPQRSLGGLPLGLRPTDVRVTATGLELDLDGGARQLDGGGAAKARQLCAKVA
jgi:hypothetical protein